MHVGLIGAETPLDIVAAQLDRINATAEYIDIDGISSVDRLVVAATTEDERFQEVNAVVIEHDIPAVFIERQGLGGISVGGLEASVVGVTPSGPCYACLQQRLESTGVTATDETPDDPTTDVLAGAYAGRLVANSAGDRSNVLDGTVIELPYTEREYLPVPGCQVCGASDIGRWKTPSEGDPRPLEAAIAAAERCYDERMGLLTEIGEAASVPLPYYLATLADTRAFSDAQAPRHAAGVSEDWDHAYMKGMGEALERYAAGTYLSDTFRTAHPAELDERVHPSACVRPDDWDAVEHAIPWIPGQEIASGDAVWVPADLVVFPPPERVTRPAITTGLALGNTEAEATCAGLLEVLERDATMLSWYSTFEPVGLDVDNPTFTDLSRRASAESLDVSVVLLTQDIDVPVIGAFVHRDGDFPQFAAGSAAGFDPTQAALDAVREALQNWMELSDMGESQAAQQAPRLAEYARHPTDVDAYLDPAVSLDANGIVDAIPEPGRETLDRLSAELADADLESYVTRLTTRDLRRVGFSAVRVVVPKAQPLLLDTPYFGKRAHEVPGSMGFAPYLDRGPHPFP